MSIFFGKGRLPIYRIIPEIDPAVSGSIWYLGAAVSCPCSGGSAFLECGEQLVAIAIKKSRQQKRNGQTRFIEANLFLLSGASRFPG
jgi:hypothetical protein